MKKLLIIAAAAAVFATPAAAQSLGGPGSTSVSIPLSGTLAKKCSISAFLDGPFNALNLESTSAQGAESVSVNCNYGGAASVTFASLNNGNLKSAANDLVPYKLLVSGSANPFSSGVQLTTAQTWTGWPATTNTNQTRSLSVQLSNAATVAGTYTDTITVSVAAN